ncbi:glycosyltransferase [Candidatus Pacearchaeota archaeon]|nr:glycosyltransferase [Candidatus Pacearchaeota archaeon]
MNLSIVIPAHNEEKRIGQTLQHYHDFFNKIKKNNQFDFEMIVVLNACKDRTESVVKDISKGKKEIKYLNFEQGGKGFAIIEGFKHSLKNDFDLIGFVDADMSTSPEAFYDLVENINDYDGIIASRWLKDSVIKAKQSFLRIITSRAFNFLVRGLFLMPYRDSQCGAKLFKKEALDKVINELITTKWAFDVDLLYKLRKHNYKVLEYPTTWIDKSESKLNLMKVPFNMFAAIVRLKLLELKLDFVVRFYDKFIKRIPN